MEEDGEKDYPKPLFWQQKTTNLRRLFFNLASFLLIAAFLFSVFAILSLIRHYSQNFKPSLVKKSWDWINLVLVLFALAFGFLSRIRNEDRGYDGSGSSNGAPPSTPNQEWCGFSDQTVGELRRNRNSSSYPDLRELAVAGGDQWRFSDDTHLNSYRVWDSDHLYRSPSWKELDRQNSVNRDDIHVDDLVNLPTKVSYAPPRRSPSPSPPRSTSAPPAAKKKTKRTYQSYGHDQERMGRKEYANSETRKTVAEELEDPPPAPATYSSTPPPPPPPPPPLPPFKMADLKYVVEGDYARLLSLDSSRSGSSDPDEVESPSSNDNDEDVTPSPLFCQSPDVDTKAGSFIAKVRAEMKLEKVNSYNKKQAL